MWGTIVNNRKETKACIFSAIVEARDVCLYLKPLEKCFDEIEGQVDFPDVKSRLKVLFHSICMTWANSKYYCKNIRITTLLKDVANLIIAEVSSLTCTSPNRLNRHGESIPLSSRVPKKQMMIREIVVIDIFRYPSNDKFGCFPSINLRIYPDLKIETWHCIILIIIIIKKIYVYSLK